MEKWVLNKQLLSWNAGQELYYEPEWNTWHVNGESLDLRGSIGEGETVLLLNLIRENKLTTIMVEVKNDFEQ